MLLQNKLSDKLGLILFYCIFISLLPILISTLLIPNFNKGSAFPLLVGGMFFLQSVILLRYFINKGDIRFSKDFFLFCWIFMIAQAITLLISTLTGIHVNSFDYINVFVRFISIFLFICIPLQFSISKKGLSNFMFSVLMLGIVACTYNMVINFDGILSISNVNNPYAVNFHSFFTNRNSFAQFLFFCLIANTYLYIKKKSNFYLLCYLVLGINIFATISRTVTASVFLFFLVMFFIYFRKKLVTKIAIFVSICFFGSVVYFNQELNNFIVEMFVRKEVGTSGRSEIWQTGLQMLSESSWIFGMGYLTSTNLITAMGFPDQFHSFYIETLVGGGILDLLLHLFIFLFVLSKILKVYKNDKATGAIFLSGVSAVLFYGLFESASFFSMGYVDSLFRIFLITLPILYANNFSASK